MSKYIRSNQLELFTAKDFQSFGNYPYKYPGLGKTTVIRVPISVKAKIEQYIKDIWEGKDRVLTDKPVTTTITPNLGLSEIPVEQIKVDPARFQYKLICSGDSGSTGSLKGVKAWNYDYCGVLSVWKDPLDNQIYVVNGHNRLALAKKLGIDILPCRFIKADTPKAAKLIGAYQNIANGDGTILDAAKIFKDANISKDQLKANGIKLSSDIVEKAILLANLDSVWFNHVLTGELDQTVGIYAGKLPIDQQSDFIELTRKEKRQLSQTVLQELIDGLLLCQGESTFELDLFGGNENSKAITIERAKLVSYVKSRLRSEELLFKKVSRSKNTQTLAKANNQIDQLTSSTQADHLEKCLNLFEALKNTASPIASMLTQTAKGIVDGGNVTELREGCYNYCLLNLNIDNLDLLIA